jgi:hypothetical protein
LRAISGFQLFVMSSVEGYVSAGMISITGQVMPEKPGVVRRCRRLGCGA